MRVAGGGGGEVGQVPFDLTPSIYRFDRLTEKFPIS